MCYLNMNRVWIINNWQEHEFKKRIRVKVKLTLWPRSMYFMATSSLVSLWRMSLATPKFPDPISLTSSYLSIPNRKFDSFESGELQIEEMELENGERRLRCRAVTQNKRWRIYEREREREWDLGEFRRKAKNRVRNLQQG